jgi:hypothetical protein
MKRKAIIALGLVLLVCASVEAQRIRKHGGLVDIDSTGAVIVKPWTGRGATVEGKLNACVDAAVNDTYACSLTPALASYATGQVVWFKANTANTGAATVNFNSLGAKTIKKVAGGITTDLATNDIRAGQWVAVIYDGTNMQMLSASGLADAGGTVTSVSGTANQIEVATGTTTPVLSLPAAITAPGTLAVTTSLTVGSGTAVTRIGYYTATLTPAEVAASTCAEQTFTVTGITAGDVVFVNKPTAQAGLGLGGVRTSGANEVAINFCNPTLAAITPTAAQVYTFGVIR